jgi:hypothetical protein
VATALLFTGLLIPVVLAAVMIVRLKQSSANDLRQQAAFAARLGLRGSTGEALALTGEYDGRPLYLTQENVRGDRGAMRSFTRARLLTSDPNGQRDEGSYRDQHGAPGLTFAVRRDEGLSFELAAGLAEVPTGDGAFDAVYRCFAAPGEASPWSVPAVRSSLRQMPITLLRVERGVAECAATFAGPVTNAAVLERIVAILASLASHEGAKRHRGELETPLEISPAIEDVRVRWAVARLMVVGICGALVVAPLLFMDWPLEIVAALDCHPGDRIVHNKNVYCTNKSGTVIQDIGGTYLLLLLDFGWGSVFAAFTLYEIGSRLGKRRAT